MTEKDITFQDKLDELKLDFYHPQSKDIVFVFVEGIADVKLFKKLLCNCKIEWIPGGNKKLEKMVKKFVEKHPLLFGIRDSDFIKLSSQEYVEPNMFLTDYHDIEITMLADDEVFSAIAFEYISGNINEQNKIKENIFNILEDVSILKWLNEIENLELVFKKVDFQHLVSCENNSIDFEQYLKNVISKSNNAKEKDLEIIKDKIQLLKSREINHLQITNGHDFLKVLSKYCNGKTNDGHLASAIRIKYSFHNFSKTNLYKDTKNWAEQKNRSIY